MRTIDPAAAAKRLVACLVGGLVLAIMWGPQEGSQNDYYYELRTALDFPRMLIFLGIGVAFFVAITFWPVLRPFMGRPGVWPLVSGTLAVLAGYTLMHWYDPLGDGKFGTVATAVSRTPDISPLTSAYFAWLAWTAFALVIVLCGAGVV